MTRLTLRIGFDNGAQLGPGKVRLLEEIGVHGSIAAAGRALGMSYRRAWTLVDSVNRGFAHPAVLTRPGGAGGGGAALSDWGRSLIGLYRAAEAGAAEGAAAALAQLEGQLAVGTVLDDDPADP